MAFTRFNPETLSRSDIVNLTNLISGINGPFIEYYTSDNYGSSEILLNIQQTGIDNYTINNTNNTNKKYYALEESQMTVTIDSVNMDSLGTTEYWYLGWQKTNYFTEQILFGNNLGNLPAGFNLGSTSSKMYLNIQKINAGSGIVPQSINFTYINNTTEQCGYRAEYSYSSQDIQYGNSVYTQYSNFGNCFYIYFYGDLTNQTQPIYASVYDNSTNSLLSTSTLQPNQNNFNVWGNQHCSVNDIRIEFNY